MTHRRATSGTRRGADRRTSSRWRRTATISTSAFMSAASSARATARGGSRRSTFTTTCTRSLSVPTAPCGRRPAGAASPRAGTAARRGAITATVCMRPICWRSLRPPTAWSSARRPGTPAATARSTGSTANGSPAPPVSPTTSPARSDHAARRGRRPGGRRAAERRRLHQRRRRRPVGPRGHRPIGDLRDHLLARQRVASRPTQHSPRCPRWRPAALRLDRRRTHHHRARGHGSSSSWSQPSSLRQEWRGANPTRRFALSLA